jgi:hypothetical protein
MVAGLTSRTQVRLDESAPAQAGAYVGLYLTVNEDTRVVVSYSAARETIVDAPFNSTISACTASNITLCPSSSMWTITTGVIYDVRVETTAAGIWLPRGGCSARTVSGVQTCAKYGGSLVLRTMRKIYAAVPYQISYVVSNPLSNQPGQIVTIDVSGLVPFTEQVMAGTAMLTDTEPGFLLLNISDTSIVLGAVNNVTLAFLTNVDLTWPASITVTGLVGAQTVDSSALPITGPSAALFGRTSQWRQGPGTIILQLTSNSVIKSGANNQNLYIQSQGTGYVDGDLVTSAEQNCSGFVGAVRTDAGGSIIQVDLVWLLHPCEMTYIVF